MIGRKILNRLEPAWKRGKSILLLGPRQTGKTTLANSIEFDLTVNLLSNRIRQEYEKNPDILYQEIAARKLKRPVKVYIDEIQKVPQILDPIQDLIDKKKAQFILTGSSARKLKEQSDINLLPGRVVSLRMDPLSIAEMQSADKLPALETLLQTGCLPEIVLTEDMNLREDILRSYVETYLEEEIRKETRLKKLPDFFRFLEFAAQYSGQLSSFSGIAQDIGISHVTVRSYFEILESTLIAERIEPIIQSRTRHKLIRSPRYLFFDLGVRRLAAREGSPLPRIILGQVFEQFVGLEIIKLMHQNTSRSTLHFWQDPQIADIDWVLCKDTKYYLPIEVKLNSKVSLADAKHLITFMKEYDCPNGAKIIYTGERNLALNDDITAVSWNELHTCIEKFI